MHPDPPAEQQEGIFQAFSQREGQSINEYGGVGIGLAMTRRIVDSMGGAIELQSALGEGTTFEVTLPGVPTTDLDDVADHVDHDRVMFSPAKVLVADDVHTNRHLIRGYLESHALTVVEADNGDEAIDLARRERPDVVLMDTTMPVLDGVKATTRMKEDEALKDVPVIALASERESEEELGGLFDGFLVKPVSNARLVEELTRFLEHDTGETVETLAATVSVGTPEWSPDTLDESARARLPALLALLEGEVQKEWEEASRTLVINDVEALGIRARELGAEYGIDPLSDWGERLQVQASTFQIDAMPKTLEEFPGLVVQLKEALSGPQAS